MLKSSVEIDNWILGSRWNESTRELIMFDSPKSEPILRLTLLLLKPSILFIRITVSLSAQNTDRIMSVQNALSNEASLKRYK